MELHVPFFKHPKKGEFEDIKSWKVIDPKRAMRTGDVLNFSCSAFLSTGIKFFTASRWNHAGMVCWLKLKLYDGTEKIELFCFELGSQNYTDLMTGKIVDKRVRLVRLADIAIMYDLISVRRLNFNRPDDFSSKFQEFMIKHAGEPFIKSIFNLLKVYLFTPGAIDKETTCSQLIGQMFTAMGISELDFDPSQLTPWHYSNEAEVFPDKTWIGPEIVIYKNNEWIRIRNNFIIIIIIILVVLLIARLNRK